MGEGKTDVKGEEGGGNPLNLANSRFFFVRKCSGFAVSRLILFRKISRIFSKIISRIFFRRICSDFNNYRDFNSINDFRNEKETKYEKSAEDGREKTPKCTSNFECDLFFS